MYRNRVACHSSGGVLMLAGLGPGTPRLNALDFSSLHPRNSVSLLSPGTSDCRFVYLQCPRPRSVYGNRVRISSEPCSFVPTIRVTQRHQGFLKVSAPGESNPKSHFLDLGNRISSPTSLCTVLSAETNPAVEENELPYEVEHQSEIELKTHGTEHSEQPVLQDDQEEKKLRIRIVFGLAIGAGLLGAVLAGGWVFTLMFSGIIWVGTGEYFDLVRSKGNVASGMTPPPPVAVQACATMCSLMPIMTLYYGGRIGVVVTTAAFVLVIVLSLQKVPRFSQLTSATFGLIYCGYLPSFWIKLRCGLSLPALNTNIAARWPTVLGGEGHCTLGLVATIISCSAIAAADTFSFLGGKIFGKTPLSSVSPKKTLEGAAFGLSCTCSLTVLLSKVLDWPSSTPRAVALGVLVFMSSLFGDLTESMIKRDAGVKDSGQLIPGHGGILDRTDSYIFTGALVYSFVKVGVPLFGV